MSLEWTREDGREGREGEEGERDICTEPPGKCLYVVARNLFLLLLNCSARPLPGSCLAKNTYIFRVPCTNSSSSFENSPAPLNMTCSIHICRDSYGYTRSTCSTDYQCPGREKCCATYHSGGSGALRCRYPVGGRYY